MMRVFQFLWFLALAACVESYSPPSVPAAADLIVVDGNVNTTDHTASVRITRPVVVNSKDSLKAERNASVSIITESGKTYLLPETKPGYYQVAGVDLTDGTACQLKVKLISGSEYQSEEIVLKKSPPIDSVYFHYKQDGLEVLVDTHDASKKTRYYQWNFEETYEYGAPFESNFKLVNRQVVPRQPADRVYRCWKTVPSTRIYITSTTQLDEDLVSRRLLVSIPVASQKTSVRYSILVKQRAISDREYTYLTQLQKTTESLGSLFDPQPSQVYGNIKRVSETGGEAIGYFSGGSYDQKRIFIGFYDLPSYLMVPPSKGTCMLDTVCLFPPTRSPIKCSIDLENLPETEMIVAEIFQGPSLIGYQKTNNDCADCRRQGGTTTRPSFW